MENDERIGNMEKRLDAMAGDIEVLKQDVGVLKEDVGVLKEDVGVLKADVGVLKQDVRSVRVLYEHRDEQIRNIAEVQAHHGRQLEEHGSLLREIKDGLAPMRDLRDFVRRIAENHEARLNALEGRAGHP